MADKALPINELLSDETFRNVFDRCYLSEDKDSRNTKEVQLD